MGQVWASSMWHCKETSFWDWLVWINQLMRNHSSNDQNKLMYSTAILDQVNLFVRTLMRILRKKKETVVPSILLYSYNGIYVRGITVIC